jgi:hypothetical protein
MNELHTYTTIMPTAAFFIIDIFSSSYKFSPFLMRQNVTNVVKKWVKKLSVGQYISDAFGWVGLEGSMFRSADIRQK